jgi:hypothetical protein
MQAKHDLVGRPIVHKSAFQHSTGTYKTHIKFIPCKIHKPSSQNFI